MKYVVINKLGSYKIKILFFNNIKATRVPQDGLKNAWSGYSNYILKKLIFLMRI